MEGPATHRSAAWPAARETTSDSQPRTARGSSEAELDVEQLARVHRLLGYALAQQPPIFLSAEYDELGENDPRRAASALHAALAWWLAEHDLTDMVPRWRVEAEIERRVDDELRDASVQIAGLYRDRRRWAKARDAYDRRSQQRPSPTPRRPAA